MTNNMSYKVHISEISVIGYLQRAAMLQVLIITMLEMIMLSLLPKVPTTTESRLCVNCEKLSTRWNICMKKRTRMFMFGIGSQFKSRYIFKLLASKGPMDGKGEKVKNVILRKVKSVQLVVHSPLELFEAVTKFFPPIHSVYLPENQNIVEPKDLRMARKIDQMLKIHDLERKCRQNGNS